MFFGFKEHPKRSPHLQSGGLSYPTSQEIIQQDDPFPVFKGQSQSGQFSGAQVQS